MGVTRYRALSSLVKAPPPLRIASRLTVTRGRWHLRNGYKIETEHDTPITIVNRRPSWLRFLLPRAVPLEMAIEHADGKEAYRITRPAVFGWNPSSTTVQGSTSSGETVGRVLQQPEGYVVLEGSAGAERPLGLVRLETWDAGSWRYGRRRIGIPPPHGQLFLALGSGRPEERLAELQPSRMAEGVFHGVTRAAGGLHLPVELPDILTERQALNRPVTHSPRSFTPHRPSLPPASPHLPCP